MNGTLPWDDFVYITMGEWPNLEVLFSWSLLEAFDLALCRKIKRLFTEVTEIRTEWQRRVVSETETRSWWMTEIFKFTCRGAPPPPLDPPPLPSRWCGNITLLCVVWSVSVCTSRGHHIRVTAWWQISHCQQWVNYLVLDLPIVSYCKALHGHRCTSHICLHWQGQNVSL